MIYEPQEDSYLLQGVVNKYAKGAVLDIGTGSGIQAVTAAKKSIVKKVLAVDIQKSVIAALQKTKKQQANKKITFLVSDLFAKIPQTTFDTIIFNPPYLPQDPGIQDRRLYGGKRGYELIERAFKNINSYLKKDGIVLLLFSSLTKQQKVDDILYQQAMEYEEVAKQHVSFEDLIVYKIVKNPWRKLLEEKHYKNIHYFSHGKRGVLYKAAKKKGTKKAWHVLKTKHPQSKAENSIANEAVWLQKLNKKKIGPTYVSSGKNYVLYEFVPGMFIADWIEQQPTKTKEEKKKTAAKIKKVLLDSLKQCRTLDLLRADKEEMHHPFKHIVISKNKAVFLDFERCHHVQDPKNVTQFCQFLSNNLFNSLLKKKGVSIDQKKVRFLAQNYKQDYSEKKYKAIFQYIKNAT